MLWGLGEKSHTAVILVDWTWWQKWIEQKSTTARGECDVVKIDNSERRNRIKIYDTKRLDEVKCYNIYIYIYVCVLQHQKDRKQGKLVDFNRWLSRNRRISRWGWKG